jgi:hypothetical protein
MFMDEGKTARPLPCDSMIKEVEEVKEVKEAKEAEQAKEIKGAKEVKEGTQGKLLVRGAPEKMC